MNCGTCPRRLDLTPWHDAIGRGRHLSRRRLSRNWTPASNLCDGKGDGQRMAALGRAGEPHHRLARRPLPRASGFRSRPPCTTTEPVWWTLVGRSKVAESEDQVFYEATFVRPNKTSFITVRITVPRQEGETEWVCSFQLLGVGQDN